MPPRTIHLTLDFDSTLTHQDTLLPLSHLGYSHNHSTPPPPWSTIVSAYLSDLSAHTTAYPYPASSRTTLSQESAWFSSLASVEEASARRAQCVWEGVGKEEVDLGVGKALEAGEVGFRRGWERVVGEVLGGRLGEVEVCSVNWSRWWIWCCLMRAWGKGEEYMIEFNADETVNERVLESVAVYANELPSVEASTEYHKTVPLGHPTHLRTANDKLSCFTSSRDRHGAAVRGKKNGTEKASKEVLSIYIGDSTSDLLCLLDADVGICMRDVAMGSGQKELEATCGRLGVKIAPLEKFDWGGNGVEGFAGKERGGTRTKLWWVTDFVEVEKWLAQLECLKSVV